MKAKIAPLESQRRKYYGTEIEVYCDGDETMIKVWMMGDCKPSKRQLKDWGFKTEEEAREDDVMCDTHYESKAGYRIAKIIANAINKGSKT